MSVKYLWPISYHEYLKVNTSKPLPEFLLSPPSFFRFRPWSEFLYNGLTPKNGTWTSTGEVQAIRKLTDTETGDKVELSLDNIGSNLGNIFSSGLNTTGNSILNNVIKGDSLLQGVGLDALGSVAGSATGLASNLIGLGISTLGGNSKLSKGIGQSVATGLGTVGGTVLSNFINTGRLAGNASKLFGTGNNIWTTISSSTNGDILNSAAINPYALGASVVGQGLQAAFGPSKEYEGQYGGITKGMDTAYDAVQAAIGFVPGWGQAAAGIMALNKGLSNVFGSTDGMTRQDAILGSAFMPAPVKWLNMAGAKTTGSFNNQSWLNTERTNAFMGNAFGNLSDKFDKARYEAGKTYGTFSHKAYNKAQNNLNFANDAWDKILAMTDLNELLDIRSQYMTSINNQRYALNIQGGWSPLYRGKQGMKILNNATNHNMGMRLLSAAALIDDKQMILSARSGTKAKKRKEDDHIYEMEPMLEVTVTAPRKYFVGYDENANPIYTTNYNESQDYLQSRLPVSSSQAKKDNWSFENVGSNGVRRPGLTGDAADLAKIAEVGIGSALAPIAAAPVVSASMPMMEAMARPLTTTTRAASKLFPSLTKALPYAEMADRDIMGTIGVTGMYNTGKDWYNGEIPWYQAIPQMGLEALMASDALAGLRPGGDIIAPITKNQLDNLGKGLKWLYNKGKVFDAPMTYNPKNFYRRVGKDAIEDANNTGLIRANPNGSFGVPFFGYRRLNPSTGFIYKDMRIIEGTPNSAEVWADSWRYASRKDLVKSKVNSLEEILEESQLYPELYSKEQLQQLNKEYAFWKDLQDNPIRDVRKYPTTTVASTEYYNDIMQSKPDWMMEFGTEAFPSNHLGATKVPTTNFTYWRKYPLLGWRKNSFKNVKTPTITPENAEILFPKSGEGYYGTRGTVVGLQKLARDSRFTPETKGTLQYLDKDRKTVRTYEGTSFIKTRLSVKVPTVYQNRYGRRKIYPYMEEKPKVTDESLKMIEEAKKYWESPERQTLNNKLREEAKSQGYVIENPEYPVFINEETPKITKSKWKMEDGPSGEFNVEDNEITLYVDNPYIAYHEGIHAYGATNPIRNLYNKTNKFSYSDVTTISKFRQNKVDRIKTDIAFGYHSSPDEFVAYGLLAGKQLNILPFSKMPSIEKVNEYWEKAKEISKYLRRNVRDDISPEDKWSLLNGTFLNYGVPITVGGSTAATLYNKSK